MVNPDSLNRLGDAMGRVYEATNDRIIINIARHFRYLKPDQKPGGAFDYQVRKLAEMGQLTQETVKIIREMLSGADAALQDCLEQCIRDALEDAEPALRKAALAGLLSPVSMPPELNPRMEAAFVEYYRQSADKLNLVNTVMLESTQEAYASTVSDIVNRMQRAQDVLNVATGQIVTGAESFNQALKLATDRMVENGITGFVAHGYTDRNGIYHEGAHWTPEAYVAMDMRTTFHNTARRAFWDKNREFGNDLYLVSQHPGARPLCFQWQCKVISRAGPHRWVTDGGGEPVEVWAQDETSYGEPAGLFGRLLCRMKTSLTLLLRGVRAATASVGNGAECTC